MSKKSDVLYGRRGGALQDPPKPRHRAVVLAMPAGRDDLRDHMVVEHRLPSKLIEQCTDAQVADYHAAEHRTRTPGKTARRHAGHLRHEHPTAAMAAMGIDR